MKRSEMVKKLAEFCEAGEPQADMILQIVEELGMLPPHRPVLVENPKANEPGFDFANEHAAEIMDSTTWEQEDEQKEQT